MINLSNVLSLPVKQDLDVKKQQEKTCLTNCSKNNTPLKLASLSVEHLKANYLTFRGNKKPVEETQPEAPSFLQNMFAGEDITGLLKFKPYEKTADLIAQNCFKGDNTMLVHEEGAMPDLVANNFISKLEQGRFKNLGMTRENTDVYYLDTQQLMAESQKPEEIQQKLGEALKMLNENAEKEQKSVVLFISDPTIVYPRIDSPLFRTVSFAPLQPQTPDGKGSQFSKEIEKILSMDPSVSLLELPSAGAPETKSFLKANKDALIHPGLPPGLIVSNKLIDKAVDMTKEKAGCYPGKAIDFIFDAVPAALMKKRIKKDPQFTVITPNNLDKAVKTYPSLFEEPNMPKPYNLMLDTKLKLKDIGGIEQIEDFVRESIVNKVDIRKTKNSQAAPPNSVLISGESGSGKTHLAKAIAGETNSPLVLTSALKLVGGQVHPQEIFDYTKSVAKDSDNKTAFLYINDFDVLAADPKTKSDLDIYRNEFFDELKKIDNKNSDINVVVLASSENAQIHQDEFSKKGVFDTKLQTPDTINSKNARLSTIRLFTKDLKFDNEKSKEKIIQETAKITDGATGADLKTVINKAVSIADRRKENKKNLTINDIYESLIELQVGPITQTEDPEWKKKWVIKHETGHAVVGQTLFNMAKEDWQKPNEIHLVTFDPRGDIGGFVSFGPGKNGMYTFDSLIFEMAIAYGGLFAEKQMFNGDFTAGPSSDLKQATTMAEKGVGMLAKGKNTGLIADPALTLPEIKKDVKLFVHVSSKISEMIVDFHKDFINEYGDECYKKLGKGGNTMSAGVFKGRLDTWLDKDDRREKLKVLEAKIEILKDEARLHGQFINDDKFLTEVAEDKVKSDSAASSKA